jgi:hypothetical protein
VFRKKFILNSALIDGAFAKKGFGISKLSKL